MAISTSSRETSKQGCELADLDEAAARLRKPPYS